MKRFHLVGLCAATFLALMPVKGASASTIFIDEPFGPTWTAGTKWITATGSTFPPSIVTISPTSALRLTDAANNQNSAIFYADPQPTSQGLDVSFKQSQWGNTGLAGADGIAFFIQKGSVTSAVAGSLGGALGYSAEWRVSGRTGLPGGLLGVGLDLHGNFANPDFGGSNCPEVGSSFTRTENFITVRGPGDGTLGYCRLASVSNSQTNWTTDNAASGTNVRLSRARSIRIVIDPSTVSPPKVKVWVCDYTTTCNTSSTPVVNVNAPNELIAEPTIRFGFSAGTGGLNNNHEIWGLQVASVNSFPAVDITTTSVTNGSTESAYSQSIAASGVAPITYSLVSGTLPPGVALNTTTGQLSGTPTSTGSFTFTIRATDSRVTTSGKTDDQAYSMSVSGPAVAVATPSTSTTTTTTTLVPTTTVIPVLDEEPQSLPATGTQGEPIDLRLTMSVILFGALLAHLARKRIWS